MSWYQGSPGPTFLHMNLESGTSKAGKRSSSTKNSGLGTFRGISNNDMIVAITPAALFFTLGIYSNVVNEEFFEILYHIFIWGKFIIFSLVFIANLVDNHL